MISIYRSNYDSEINEFHGRERVRRSEVEFVPRVICGTAEPFARPAKSGFWAFGGTFLYTSNGIFPEFNRAVPLHDRNMALESKGIED